MNSTQNTYQRLYGTSLGQSYLSINGSRLPTYLQVLLSYESNRQKLKTEKQGTKLRFTWKNQASEIVYKKVIEHYKKSSIDVKSFGAFCYEFEKALKHHKSLVKGSKKGKGRDLNKTMPLWPKNTEEIMKKEAGNTFSISRRKSIINTNLQFL